MIEGRVAQILNERELIINRGRTDGVTEGMVFEVLAENSLEVTDPETGQSLGLLDRPKVRAQASDVRDRFAVCETFELVEVRGALIDPSEFFAPRRLPTTLRATEALPPLSPEESIVKVGDRVKELRARRALRSRAAAQQSS